MTMWVISVAHCRLSKAECTISKIRVDKQNINWEKDIWSAEALEKS